MSSVPKRKTMTRPLTPAWKENLYWFSMGSVVTNVVYQAIIWLI